MAKLITIRSDLQKEEHGVWATYPGTDVECRIARVGNAAFMRARDRIREDEEVIAMISSEDATEEQARITMAPYMAEYIWLETKNLQNDDESDFADTVEARTELLKDPSLHDLFEWIGMISRKASLFRM